MPIDYRPELIPALALLWLAYFILHSVLASLRVKRWVAARWSSLLPYYRLLFNALGLVFVIPPLWLTLFARGPYLWRWEGIAGWVADGLALLAVAGFLWTLRWYSGAEFLGTEQLRQGSRTVEDQEHFFISPPHRFVRHPWYFFGLLIVWTRDMDPMFFTSAVAITLYLFIGSRFEERKLITYHGDTYRLYRARVPGIIPLPWRYLPREEARKLVERNPER